MLALLLTKNDCNTKSFVCFLRSLFWSGMFVLLSFLIISEIKMFSFLHYNRMDRQTDRQTEMYLLGFYLPPQTKTEWQTQTENASESGLCRSASCVRYQIRTHGNHVDQRLEAHLKRHFGLRLLGMLISSPWLQTIAQSNILKTEGSTKPAAGIKKNLSWNPFKDRSE